jgi:hypothetical protein
VRRSKTNAANQTAKSGRAHQQCPRDAEHRRGVNSKSDERAAQSSRGAEKSEQLQECDPREISNRSRLGARRAGLKGCESNLDEIAR